MQQNFSYGTVSLPHSCLTVIRFRPEVLRCGKPCTVFDFEHVFVGSCYSVLSLVSQLEHWVS